MSDHTTLLLHSATAIDERGETPDAWVLFDGDLISATGVGMDTRPYADQSIDLDGAILAPGFIDLHGHGGGGHAFDDGGDELRAALDAHRRAGTTRSVVSLVANPLTSLRELLGQIADLTESDPLVLGSHLEGPFLARARRGAHNPEFLRDPDDIAIDSLLDAAHGTLRQVTIAPELPGGLDAVTTFARAGVTVALGHTEVDAATARAAFDAGARLLTHTFNAMPGIHHRDPGPVVAAIADERVTLELVLDGLHVRPDVARMVMNAAPGRVALITDAMAAAGAEDGNYRIGSLNVTVLGGKALLSGTQTLAGSTLTQDAAVRCAITEVGVTPVAAVAAATVVPARVLGLGDRFGLLAPGYAADAVVLDEAWNVTSVWAAGRAIPR